MDEISKFCYDHPIWAWLIGFVTMSVAFFGSLTLFVAVFSPMK